MRDIIKNFIQPEALALLHAGLKEEFNSEQLATTGFYMSLERNGLKILDFDPSGADAVIALHVCDMATDDAIYKRG
ncbi:MAG: SAM-dependent methyltransferase [Candidatus Devosia symbiotica]|nr:SAM-dependent methyltransferase [Candidatus Devosia symbiotica]